MTAAVAPESAAPPASPPKPARHRFRSVVAWILVVVASLLVPLSIVAGWVHRDIVSEQGYVNTVAPLARQSAVTDAIANRVVEVLFSKAKVENRVTDLLPDFLDPLGRALTSSVEGLAQKQVGDILASSEFEQIWTEANRAAHTEVVRLFTGRGKVVKTQGDAVVVDFGALANDVRQRLVKKGVTVLKLVKVPPGVATITLVQSPAIERAQPAFALLDDVSTVLPFVTLGLFVLAVVVSPRRRRMVVVGGVGCALMCAVFLVGLSVAREFYLTATSNADLNQPAAEAVYDTLTRALPDYAWAFVGVGVVAAVVAFVSDPARLARLTRLVRGDRVARSTGLAAWVDANRVIVRIAIVAAAALVLAVRSTTTVLALVVILGVMVVALGIVSALVRIAREAPPADGTGADAVTVGAVPAAADASDPADASEPAAPASDATTDPS